MAATKAGLSETEVAERLLPYLRRELGSDSIAFADPPSRILGGFDTLTYGFRLAGAPPPYAAPLILRIYRQAGSRERAPWERAVQNAVADLGYPAPRVLLSSTGDGENEAFVIMERLPGRIMLDYMFRPSMPFFSWPRVLATTQARLHALDATAFLRDLEQAGIAGDILGLQRHLVWLRDPLDRLGLAWLRPGIDWAIANQPRENDGVICHGDFHPLNILVERGAVAGVIDWSLPVVARPEFDVGATAAILSHGPLEIPSFLHSVFAAVRRRLVAAYVREYRKLRPLNEDALRYFEGLRTLGFLTESSEHWAALAAGQPPPNKPAAFTAPAVARRVLARFEELTGIALDAPIPAA